MPLPSTEHAGTDVESAVAKSSSRKGQWVRTLHIDEQRGWRGGEQQAGYLVRGLAERGHTVVLAGRANGAFLSGDYGPNIRERVAALFLGECDLFTAWLLARTVKRHAIDIIHAHTSHAHTLACLARVFAGRGRVVVSRRVDFPPKRHGFNRWKYGAPDQIVAISNRIADVLRSFGVPETKLSVVHSCIDPSRFDVEPVSRSELGVPAGAPLLGNVAALVDHKDHATLIAAMPAVLCELPDARLVVAGEGPLRRKLERQIAELGLGGAVTLLGYRKDVPRLLRTLDAFVLSSKLEGLGTSILDAMACELPVVATAAGGIPEVVQDEKTGFLVPPQDPEALASAILRVFREPAYARGVARAGKALVCERFAVKTMVEGNLRVYERLLSGETRPQPFTAPS